jgi:hypothetical protein
MNALDKHEVSASPNSLRNPLFLFVFISILRDLFQRSLPTITVVVADETPPLAGRGGRLGRGEATRGAL